MRLLHARHPDVIHRFPSAQPEAVGRTGSGCAERPHLPLHRLHRDRFGRSRSGRYPGFEHGRTAMNESQETPQAAKQIYRELVTINGKNVVLSHDEPPVINAGVLENGDIFRMINIFAEKFSPSNIDKADGTPLRLYTSDRVKIDVSKRRKPDMGSVS